MQGEFLRFSAHGDVQLFSCPSTSATKTHRGCYAFRFECSFDDGPPPIAEGAILFVASSVQDNRGWERSHPASLDVYLPSFIATMQHRVRTAGRSCALDALDACGKNMTYGVRSTLSNVIVTYGVASRHTWAFAPEATGGKHAVGACALVNIDVFIRSSHARHVFTAQQVTFRSVFDSQCRAGIDALRTPPEEGSSHDFFYPRRLSSLRLWNVYRMG